MTAVKAEKLPRSEGYRAVHGMQVGRQRQWGLEVPINGTVAVGGGGSLNGCVDVGEGASSGGATNSSADGRSHSY